MTEEGDSVAPDKAPQERQVLVDGTSQPHKRFPLMARICLWIMGFVMLISLGVLVSIIVRPELVDSPLLNRNGQFAFQLAIGATIIVLIWRMWNERPSRIEYVGAWLFILGAVISVPVIIVSEFVSYFQTRWMIADWFVSATRTIADVSLVLMTLGFLAMLVQTIWASPARRRRMRGGDAQ